MIKTLSLSFTILHHYELITSDIIAKANEDDGWKTRNCLQTRAPLLAVNGSLKLRTKLRASEHEQ